VPPPTLSTLLIGVGPAPSKSEYGCFAR
jgi:hypothetical protein